jgi:cell fate regulator YaaT (PSP1 superfamily)
MNDINNNEPINQDFHNSEIREENQDQEIISGQNSDQNEEELSGEDQEKKSRFKEGQKLQFVRVRFPGHAKSLPFIFGRLPIHYGQQVVAMSERGMCVGYINSFPYTVDYHPNLEPVRSIKKIATQDDFDHEKKVYQQEKQFENICAKLIEKHQLEMQLTHVEFTQFGKKVVFYFFSPGRVDFRGLVKDLVNELKVRIELRQISIRDRAASIGNIGPCGRELCCSSFLSKYGNTHIKMARNQNLSLNTSKTNGVCASPKCCLSYEDAVYTEIRERLPVEDSIIKTKVGDIGKVTRLHLITMQFEMLTEQGIVKKYAASEFIEELKDYAFPEYFEHIQYDNRNCIGIEDYEKEEKTRKDKDKNELLKHTKKEAADLFEQQLKDSPFLSTYIEKSKEHQ